MIQASRLSGQLVGVQYLRAIAATSVVLLHVTDQIPRYEPVFQGLLPQTLYLWHGVDLFFVISGFIIFLTDDRYGALDFIIRRAIRVVPLYWLLTTLVVILGLWKPAWFRSTVISGEYFIKSLLFVPYANPGQNGHIVPLLVPGWSLNLEMVFYGIFALCLLLQPGWRIGGVAIAFSLLVLTALSLSGTQYASQLHFIGNVRLMEFWLGMVAGRMYAAGLLRMPLPVSLLLIMLGCWALLFGIPVFRSDGSQWNRVIFGCGIPAVCILVGTVASEDALTRRRLDVLSVIGNASYSIYLSQVFFLGAARMSWSALDHSNAVSPLKAVGFSIYSISLVMIGGLAVHGCVELPLHRTLKEMYLRYRPGRHGAVG